MKRREFVKFSTGVVLAASSTANLWAAGGANLGDKQADTPNLDPQATKSMVNLTLNNGIKMPILGYGTYQITASECERCVSEALEVGYRLIDTARYYRNEHEVGVAVSKSGIKREEIFITSKIYASGYEAARRDIDDSTAKMGGIIDLMLIHWPVSDDIGTYKALEKALAQGQIRAIGISNYYGNDLARILKAAKIHPALNQVECHIFRQQIALQRELDGLGKIKMQAWSPFGGGSHTREVLGDATLKQIAKKYGKSSAQIVLRWLVQRGVSVVPKTTRRERMAENFAIFDFELNAQDMSAIAALDQNRGLFGWYS